MEIVTLARSTVLRMIRVNPLNAVALIVDGGKTENVTKLRN